MFGRTFGRRSYGILTLVYVVIGAFVAGANDYFDRLGSFQPILSALLAIFLWPLVLLGVDLHIGR
jgi:cell shape-determining protein MreD